MGERRRRQKPWRTHHWWVVGPDINGPVIYRRSRTYKAAVAHAKWMGGGLYVVRAVLHGERDVLADMR